MSNLEYSCPKCGRILESGAVFCVACGYDTRTGQQVSGPRSQSRAAGEEVSAQNSVGSLTEALQSKDAEVRRQAFETLYNQEHYADSKSTKLQRVARRLVLRPLAKWVSLCLHAATRRTNAKIVCDNR